ncbi:MAG TPA: hypothetical protein VHJ99_13245 [Candidatus Dormibacteraeota bacterium]|jgi:hypothetical protein|nr:hypothetical protein [Candidatus Dormibacteraeota bacterium]
MWKSLLKAVVEGFAISDPVGYMHYLECKRATERQAEVIPYRAPSRDAALRPVDGSLRSREERLA